MTASACVCTCWNVRSASCQRGRRPCWAFLICAASRTEMPDLGFVRFLVRCMMRCDYGGVKCALLHLLVGPRHIPALPDSLASSMPDSSHS